MQTKRILRSSIRGFAVASVAVLGSVAVDTAQSSEQLLGSQTITLDQRTQGAGSPLHVPARGGTITYYYTITPANVPIRLMIVTNEQYQAGASGEKAQGRPIFNKIVMGQGTNSTYLPGGDYWDTWVFPDQPSRVTITFRKTGQ
jgi:hypothetical protein